MKLKLKDFFFVAVQFLLFAVYVFDIDFWQFKTPLFLNIVSIFITIVGLLTVITAILQLNKNISPFPTPKSDSELIQNGLYKYVRHPIYTGVILMLFGYGLYANSSFKIIISLVLLMLFYFKSSYEEQRLQNVFPNYMSYKKSAGRFFPKV